MNVTIRRLLPAAAGAAFVIGLMPLALAEPKKPPSATDASQHLNALGEVLEKIRRDFVGPVDDRKLIEGAIRGALQTLDSNSSYYSADDFRRQREAQQGKYGGLGVEVKDKDGAIEVVSPLDDAPAARAGLQPGDIVTHVDDIPLKGLGLAGAVARMRGPVGTSVKLTIVRQGRAEPLTVVVVRENITVRSVRTRAQDDVGYLRIATFNRETLGQLSAGVRALADQIGGDRLKGFVLDLRNNSGGVLDSAIAVADEFLSKGEIVSERRKRPDDVKRYNAKPGDILGGKAMVVLVNRGTASGAEIVAGALSDHRRAVVVGTRSFGSGVTATIFPVKQLGGAFRLTTGYLYRPSGRLIEGNGIDPDHVIEGASQEPEKDKPLQLALNLLRGGESPRQGSDSTQKPSGGLGLESGDPGSFK